MGQKKTTRLMRTLESAVAKRMKNVKYFAETRLLLSADTSPSKEQLYFHRTNLVNHQTMRHFKVRCRCRRPVNSKSPGMSRILVTSKKNYVVITQPAKVKTPLIFAALSDSKGHLDTGQRQSTNKLSRKLHPFQHLSLILARNFLSNAPA